MMAATVLTKLYHHLRGVLLIAPWALALLLQDLLLTLLHFVVRPFSPATAYRLASYPVAWSCWAWIQLLFERASGARIVVSGDPLPRGESAVVVCNHVGWCDFYMIQALAARAGMLGYCRYFAKAQLKKVPLLGWGLAAMGMPLVTRNWQHDRRELDRVFHGLTHHRFPMWLIAFSEATRYTPEKYAESVAWCAANGRPQPRHLLYPRTKGFVATVSHLQRCAAKEAESSQQQQQQQPAPDTAAPVVPLHVRAVYDVTIAYYQRGGASGGGGGGWQTAPAFWDTVSVPELSGRGGGYRFEVNVRRWPMEGLPTDEDELARWLEERWVEKGEWLEQKRVEWESEEELASKKTK